MLFIAVTWLTFIKASSFKILTKSLVLFYFAITLDVLLYWS